MNSLKLILAAIIVNFYAVSLFATSPEFGKATYYNDKYHGKKTASGELYDREKYTCAHKTLKFGTIVRVTRLDNQLSVEVRVNDRGPYTEGFVVDVSYAAAEMIGLVKSGGKANVKVEVVEAEVVAPIATQEAPLKPAGYSTTTSTAKPSVAAPANTSVPTKPALVKGNVTTNPATMTPATPAPTPKPAPVAPALYQTIIKKVNEKGFGVQLQSLSTAEIALSELAKLQETLDGSVLLKTSTNQLGETSYKIILGPFATKKEAEVQQKAAVKKGHKKCFVVDLSQ